MFGIEIIIHKPGWTDALPWHRVFGIEIIIHKPGWTDALLFPVNGLARGALQAGVERSALVHGDEASAVKSVKAFAESRNRKVRLVIRGEG